MRRMRRKRILHQPLDRFLTDRAAQAIALAQQEAKALRHSLTGTEHLLLGLLRLDTGVGAQALSNLGINLRDVREQVEQFIGQGSQAPAGEIPFSPRAQQVLQASRQEAFELGHIHLGTEHILLGLIREGQGAAARVLAGLGVDLPTTRHQIIRVLHGH